MTGEAKKFGAFSGVFTPSILTILGVIMYLRLGWVAGVAGLTGIIAVILLAHVISFTTGLSISSIATDKRIKAGGIYYILSRSLGLPMGGSIGITLFVGTALSISLYIIGFTESFLSLPTIQGWIEALGMVPDSLNTTRIVGTAVLILLVIIAFISTNIAIKTQFIILTAIALSLISIFIGFFVHPDLAPQPGGIDIAPFKDFSFEVVFAVFFPAVTGFTAGVAMSGDLKDPKKDIPKGTMWAIIIGFVVYLVLGISFVLFVDRDVLLHDYNFLLRLAWIPALVIAGIWGATLSSALGGILGGPRILQAVANDKIAPKFFAKGYGASNEPRNALLFTFLISELGVLVGDLNIIAGIVTMFYLTAYGFINLAFALEKWASADFRPSFNVSVWFGVVGFVASFMIMFKLDMVNMFVALIILGIIYYYISRKHHHRRMSSVWEGVNMALVRAVLNKLNKQKTSEQNWKPNILLFSGGTKKRPYLIEFGKALVAQQGMVSNFDLTLNQSAKELFPKRREVIIDNDTESNKGIFAQKLECNDVFKGIETIASVYGFSGVEPNTILMGWGRNSDNPLRFVSMVNRLINLNLNVVLLDYDKERGFGSYSTIDLWWRGGSNNGNFVLALIKFIHSTYEWRNARVRIMIVNPVNENKSWIERDARNVLANMRIDAEIRVINNEIDKRTIYEIIKQESINTDLVFIGFPDIVEGKEEEFIKGTDRLCLNIGTTALVKASSLFQELHIGFVPGNSQKGFSADNKQAPVKIPSLAKPLSGAFEIEIKRYYEHYLQFTKSILEQHLDPLFSQWYLLIANIEKAWISSYELIHQKLQEQDADLRIFITNQNLQLAIKTKKLTKKFYTENEIIMQGKVEALTAALESLQTKMTTLLPNEITISLTDEEQRKLLSQKSLAPGEEQMLARSKEFTIPFLKIKERVLLADLAPAWLEMLKELGYAVFKLEIKLSKLNDLIEQYQVGKYYSKVEYQEVIDTLTSKEHSFTELIDELRASTKQNRDIIGKTMLAGITRSFNKSIALCETPYAWKRVPGRSAITRMKKAEKTILQFEEVWIKNRQIISNSRVISLQLLAFKLRLRHMLVKDINLFNLKYDEYREKVLHKLENDIQERIAQKEKVISPPPIETTEAFKAEFQNLFENDKTLVNKFLTDFPNRITLFNDEKFQNYKTHQLNLDENTVIDLAKLLDHIVNNDLLASLEKLYLSVSNELKRQLDEIDAIITTLQEDSTKEAKSEQLEQILITLDKLDEKTGISRENTELSINERLNATWDKLTLSTLSIQNEMLSFYVREDKSALRKNRLIMFIKKVLKR